MSSDATGRRYIMQKDRGRSDAAAFIETGKKMSILIVSISKDAKKKLDLIVKDENIHSSNELIPWKKSGMIEYLICDYYNASKRYIEKWFKNAP